MNSHDEHDRSIEELFHAARRADRASAPGFQRTVQAKRQSRQPVRRGLPLVCPAVLAWVGGLSLAVAAVWLVFQPQMSGPSAPLVTKFSPVLPPPPAELSLDHEIDTRTAGGVAGDTAVGTAVGEDRTRTVEISRNQAADPAAVVREPSDALQTPAPRAERKSAERPAPPVLDEQTLARLSSLGYSGTAADETADAEFLVGLAAPSMPIKRIAEEERARSHYYQATVMLSPEGDVIAGMTAQEERRLRTLARTVPTLSAAGEAALVDAPGLASEAYAPVDENPFREVRDHPLSTFSIDVDTASYTNVRRFIGEGRLPPRDAVRIEELINYFRYDYPSPDGDAPFSAGVEIADCPWNPDHRLARIGLKGREIVRGEYRGSNLVFLIDVSGSMGAPNKLPLVKSALSLLAEQLDGRDRVAMVVYAGSSGLVLPATSGDARSEILDALDRLDAGGSTNGGEGLRLAYRIARESFIRGGVNRVILATDGDVNVGVTGKSELLRLIEKDAKKGIFLTVLGVGTGNYKDDTLELLADRGNGNYAYLDSLREARRVLVEQIGGTLVTIAKDVKIQLEFNPLQVGAYRLIGYENRMLAKEDFNDDAADAGEIGSGHTVTALYELVPPGATRSTPTVDPLKYQQESTTTPSADSGELLTLKVRYKEPEGEQSRLLSYPVVDEGHTLDSATADFKFAAAVAMFGMVLRDSERGAEVSLEHVLGLTLEGMGRDAGGQRAEFHDLVGRTVKIRAIPVAE